MARIVREGDLVKIFATQTNGTERLAALARDGRPAFGKMRFYDLGTHRTYTSTYRIGMAPARARVFRERPEELCQLFREAGLAVPHVVPPLPIGSYLYRLGHAVMRGAQGFLNRQDRPSSQPGGQTIR